MIVFLATAGHRYTHAAVVHASPNVTSMSYDSAFRSRRLRRATYIFTDFDRLGFWELELAADLFRVLSAAGCKVLNDPARALQRHALLVRLHETGLNDFNAWRADEAAIPDRFPVFLRTQSAHRGVLSGLLQDCNAAQVALETAMEQGYPIRDLMFVEYRAAPTEDGLYWKHSVYRIGDTWSAGPSVLDRSWVAKEGVKGLAADDHFEFERTIVQTGRFADALRPAFLAASIEYGRADFTVVDGRIAVYEINTNPFIAFHGEHRSPIRSETQRLLKDGFLRSLAILDEKDDRRSWIRLKSDRFETSFKRRHGIRRFRTP